MRRLAFRLRLIEQDGFPTLGGLLFGAFGAVGLLLLIIWLAVVFGGRAYGRATCDNWGKQTGIRTKFVVLNWGDSGTCLAQTPDGRWVINSQWQAFVKANRP